MSIIEVSGFDAVGDDVVEAAREVDLHAVREVSALVERETEERVAGAGDRVQDGRVRRRARVRLDVGELGAEERLRALDRELLGDVDLFAAAVVAAARVALGVLVREHRALRLQDRDGHEVLGRDHLEVAALTLELALEHLGDLGVDLGEGGVEVLIGHDDLLDDGFRGSRHGGAGIHIGPGARSNAVVSRSPVVVHLNASRDTPSIADRPSRSMLGAARGNR